MVYDAFAESNLQNFEQQNKRKWMVRLFLCTALLPQNADSRYFRSLAGHLGGSQAALHCLDRLLQCADGLVATERAPLIFSLAVDAYDLFVRATVLLSLVTMLKVNPADYQHGYAGSRFGLCHD